MTTPSRSFLSAYTSYACTNCGHWQRWFASGPPPTSWPRT